jgi:hypothetical protein
MTDQQKTLVDWSDQGDITNYEKETLKEMGVKNSSLNYFLEDLKRLLEWDETIKKRGKEINITGQICKMIFFSAWWNNNLLIVVNETTNKKDENEQNIYLLIHEMSSGSNIEEIFEVRRINSFDRNNSWRVEDRVKNLERTLKGDTPILYWKPTLMLKYGDEPEYKFAEIKVCTFKYPNHELEKDPDKYLKPFDIVKNYWQKDGGEMLHSAIYLGNRKVCHARPKTYYNEYRELGEGFIEIMEWNKYLQFKTGQLSQLVRFHPFIPYQNRDAVIKNLAKSIENYKEFYQKRSEGKFNIETNNCEQFANMITYGVDISERAEAKKVQRKAKGCKKLWNFNLKNKIEENQKFFDDVTSSSPKAEIVQEIEKCVNSVHHSEGIELTADVARIEVRPSITYRMTKQLS